MNTEFERIVEKSGFKFSKEQQQAIDTRKNAVVSAGAGSGKTTVLAFRFLNLILSGIPIEKLLALTFTRKAALEMKDRIYKLLNTYKDENDKIKTAFENFSHSSITTLDAFSREILKTSLKDYGISENFTVISDIQNDENIKSLTLQCINEDRENSESFLTYFSPSSLIDDVLLKIASSSSFTISSGFNSNKEMKIFDECKIQEKCDEVFDKIIEVGETLKRTCKENIEIEKYVRNIPEVGECILAFTKGSEFYNAYKKKDYDALLFYKTLLENIDIRTIKYGPFKDAESKEKIDIIKDCIKVLKGGAIKNDEMISAYPTVELIYLFEAYITTFQSMPKINKMLKFLECYYNKLCAYKRENSILTFQDIAILSKDVLLKNKEVREFYKNKFDNIMIDEFQDNNILQKEILYLLSEKKDVYNDNKVPPLSDIENGKLFFVGDQKQSIYRFRSADVSVFKSLSEELKSNGGESILLNANFRSRSSLVDFSNTLFKSIMGEHNSESYNADFESTISLRNENTYKNENGETLNTHIEFYSNEKAKNDEDADENSDEEDINSRASEASKIRELVENVVKTNKYAIVKNGKVMMPKYDDIAVIFRTRSSLVNLEKALSEHNIPYTTSSSSSMFNSTIVNDIYSILSLVLYPTLKTSLLAVLRSPYCSLSNEASLKLLEKDGSFPFNDVDFESSKDKQRYDKFIEHYQKLKKISEEGDASDALSYIWYDMGSRLYTIQNRNTEHEERYFDALFFQACEKKSLFLFVKHLEDIIENGKKNDSETTLYKEGEKGVSLLTIHESKGLEFPIVILAFLGNRGKNSTTSFEEVYSEDHGYFLLPNYMDVKKGKNIITIINKDSEKKKEKAELKRLFYVAVTRAKDHLIMLGDFGRTKRDEIVKGSDKEEATILSLFEANQKEFDTLLTKEDKIEQISSSSVYLNKFDYEALYKKQELFDVYKANECNNKSVLQKRERGSITGVIVENISSKKIQLPSLVIDKCADKDPNLITEFGTFAHKLLEDYFKYGIKPTENYNICYSSSSLTAEMQCEAKRVVEEFVSSQFVVTLKQQGFTFLSEYRFFAPFDSTNKKMVLEGSVDLLCFNKNGNSIVIDFKTDKFCDPSSHKEQLSLYKEAVKKLFDVKDIKTGIVYLRDSQKVYYVDV